MKCTIERYIDGAWVAAASLTTSEPEAGSDGPCVFEYNVDYAVRHLGQADAQMACAYPVNLEHRREPVWPGFIVDLLPQGAGRRRVLGELGISGRDGPSNDWAVLLAGGGNPPGDLRIGEAAARFERHPHPGFTQAEVVARHETFIEYAIAHGAPVAGSSGAQGEAPKFLLTVDREGRWHADGALSDNQAARHYLVKFPRGKALSDREILRNEAPYYEVARGFGLRVGAQLSWVSDCLFVPRFDRKVRDGVVVRYGMESLYALAGISGFGVAVTHNRLVDALARYTTDLHSDLLEYVKRDVLNVALRNTDNHGRNTAVLKRHGAVCLSPLYDFAPMFLDDAGIARICRWEASSESGGLPVWGRVAEQLVPYGMEATATRHTMADWAEEVRQLPQSMYANGVDPGLIERLSGRIEEVARCLSDAGPSIFVNGSPRP